jgi:hypothetical protein
VLALNAPDSEVRARARIIAVITPDLVRLHAGTLDSPNVATYFDRLDALVVELLRLLLSLV